MHMRHGAAISLGLAACAVSLTGCEARNGDAVTRAPDPGVPAPVYLGIETRLLEGDLVSFHVRMKNASGRADLMGYADCAAAQYALIRGYGFARQVRTTAKLDDDTLVGDAVYTISAALPRGIKTIDAEVTVSNCAESGIPTV